MKVQSQIPQKAFVPEDGFIKNFQKLIKDVVIPYQYDVLHDNAKDNAEKSHVVKNFINAGKALAGLDTDDGFYGMVFQDSDAAKWLEAVGFALSIFPDKELEANADKLIEIIANAQDTDGYLDTYFTIKDKDKRFTNLLEGHELYCAGHMMEAACAYYETTGKKKLLDVMEKNVECIYNTFIKGDSFKQSAFPGHPEVELALMKMYRLTGNKHCLELAQHFVDVRGVDPFYYEKEVQSRSWSVWGSDGKNHFYNQADVPVREQKNAEGHAVRAVYLYTAMADLASVTEDKSLSDACRTLWESITQKQMYITGGIGSTVLGESFSVDYDLPSDTAYCETCASIGLMYFASRMLELEVDRKYSDVMEKAFYNTVLGGMQQDGKRFFYVNPLEVIPGIAGKAQTHMHDLPQRPTWYACACCPPNVARTVSSFGKYAYGENSDTVFCHMFASGTVNFSNGTIIKCKTEYPYEFTVEYTVSDCRENSKLAVRIPEWSRKWNIEIFTEGKKENFCGTLLNGYAYISVSKGCTIKLILDESAYFVYPSTRVPDLSGQVAVCKGPLVYCAEGVDNKEDILSLSIDTSSKIKSDGKNISVHGFRASVADSLYSMEPPVKCEEEITMIPYYTWGNRGLTQMKVWFPREK